MDLKSIGRMTSGKKGVVCPGRAIVLSPVDLDSVKDLGTVGHGEKVGDVLDRVQYGERLRLSERPPEEEHQG